MPLQMPVECVNTWIQPLLEFLGGVAVGMIRGPLLCATTSHDYCVGYFHDCLRRSCHALTESPNVLLYSR